MAINYKKILRSDASFQLVRTNPKLTGNVKMTVDDKGNMWLNSIDVSSELANQIYKRFPLDPDVSLPSSMYRFFQNGTTPSEIVFDIKEDVNPTETSTDYKDQYDFSFYFSGVKYLTSKLYKEKLSYFAPLYLKDIIPDYFIIFKVKDPMNYRSDVSKSEFYDEARTNADYLIDMFSNATIVKTFDLREDSKVGSYIRKYYNDPNFPKSPLTVNFDKDGFTYFNGIMYDSGAFGSRGEMLDDLYSDANPLKFFEENITLGFERNKMIFPNILNLEFIFDPDDESDLYDIDRYVGFYVNRIDLDELNIDLDRLYDERSTFENTPKFTHRIQETEDKVIYQYNEDGVLLPYKDANIELDPLNLSFTDSLNMYINYLLDKNGNFHSLKLNDTPIIVDRDQIGNELNSGKFRFYDKKKDIGLFFGPSSVFFQDKATAITGKGYSHNYIKILSSLNHLDTIKIYHPFGSKSDSNGKYDELIATTDYNVVQEPGDFYAYNDIDNSLGYDEYYFNAAGKPKEVAEAIAGCLRSFRIPTFKVVQLNEYIFIKATSPGDHDDKYKISFIPSINFNDYSNIEIGGKTGSQLNGITIQFEGGSIEDNNRFIVDSKNTDRILNNIDKIAVMTENGWSKIRKLSSYIDVINDDIVTDIDKIKAINDYFDNVVITLEDDEKPDVKYGECVIRFLYRIKFGMFSFFQVKDFSFDFYDSQYSSIPDIDLYSLYFIPPNVKLLSSGTCYRLIGEGSIQINETGDVITSDNPKFTTTVDASYSILNGNPTVTYDDCDTGRGGTTYTVPIYDKNGDIISFKGFNSLIDPFSTVEDDGSELFKLKGKFVDNISSSEYNFYKENETKDFALKSKLIPYITKWAYKDGLDARGNPYRLNVDLAFGYDNFSPNHNETVQDPEYLTHEWFYLESVFNYINAPETLKSNKSYFDTPFILDNALLNPDYFTDYFTYTPNYAGVEVNDTQFRYSKLFKNSNGEYETLLKGFKINFNDVIDNNIIGPNGKPIPNANSNRFDGYSFSCLMKVIEDDINDDTVPPIRYRFIEHSTFKFILLLIEIRLSSIEQVNNIWKSSPLQYTKVENSNFLNNVGSTKLYDTINGDYKIKFETIGSYKISNLNYALLYSMKHKKYNTELNAFSNVKLSSKLDLSNAGMFNGGSKNIERLDNTNILNYPSYLKDEIGRLSNSTFIFTFNKLNGVESFIDVIDSSYIPQHISEASSVSNDFITMLNNTGYALVDSNDNVISNLPSGIPSSIFQEYFTFKVITAGENYYDRFFSKISFAKFKEYVNSYDDFIEYESYYLDENGNLQKRDDAKFYAEIPDVDEIEKISGLIVAKDDNVPFEFSSYDVIGYSYVKSQLDNAYEINRYKGYYEPIFDNVITFQSGISIPSSGISDPIRLANVNFNPNFDRFGIIKNFNHLKISDRKILELEANASYDPLYEKIGEIAIGRADYFIFSSNWEYGFHHKYLDKFSRTPVSGTLRLEEDFSFIAKVMKLQDIIELDNFNVLKLDKNDDLTALNLDDIEIAYKETNLNIEGYINIENTLLRYFIEDNIGRKIIEYVIEDNEYIGSFDSIDDYVKDYVKINIIKLFNFDNVSFYTLQDKTKIDTESDSNVNTVEFVMLDDKQRYEEGYKLDKNLEINKKDRMLLSFKFNKKTDSSIKISPKIKIKFI